MYAAVCATNANIGNIAVFHHFWEYLEVHPDIQWGCLAKMDARPFTDVACRQIGVHYEEHGYECPKGLYTSVGA